MLTEQLEASPTTTQDVAVASAGTGLERYRLGHRALPGRDLADVSLDTPLLGTRLAAPVLLDARPGADAVAAAAAAEAHGLGLIAAGTPALRERPPLLLAALPVVALLDDEAAAERAVEALAADGLALELDVVGAALAGGDARAAGAEAAIAAACARLAPLPVLVREVGAGFDGADARALGALGAAAVDVGGAGAFPDPAFADWGVPAADAVAEAALLAPGVCVVAGRGATDGVRAAICLALGAGAVAIAPPAPAADAVATFLHQLRVAVWASGVAAASELHPGHLRERLA